ncbi:MAG: hypothetical protein IKB87_00995 [Clostridia bacterium]|nr:hypothetical protein [Clostridia bacterium]
MHIAMLDLMPLLWGLCILISAALFCLGDYAAPARTVPAAVMALILHFTEKPPRLQVALFAVLYVICALVYAVLCRVARRAAENKRARFSGQARDAKKHNKFPKTY